LIDPIHFFLGASNQTMTSSVKITCDCGTIVNKRGLSSHKKTHKHMWRMEAKEAWEAKKMMPHTTKMIAVCEEITTRCMVGVCRAKASWNLGMCSGRGAGVAPQKSIVCKGCLIENVPYYLGGEFEGVRDLGLAITGNPINTWGQNKKYLTKRGKNKQQYFKPCDNTSELCNGGRAFNIRDKMFCSPCCGNQHFNLTPSDADFWQHKCYECFDCESEDEDED
jgi:hypothetical protein